MGNANENNPTSGFKTKRWLLVAIFGFVAAFFFQWKNSVDQASIATTDSGEVVRVKTASPRGYFRIFFNGENKDFASPLLCDENGDILCELKRTPEDSELFFCPEESLNKNPPRDQFLRLVFPKLQYEKRPIVLVIKNPF